MKYQLLFFCAGSYFTLGNVAPVAIAQDSKSTAKSIVDSSKDSNQPRPTPITRPEMKRLLEDMKLRTERIPLPPLSDAEKEGDPRLQGYEGRLGKLYLPATAGIRGYLNFSGSPKRTASSNPPTPVPNRPLQEEDTALTLDYGFKTRLFWIASRANNCQYCLGHQESKLLGVGMLDDEIAALDSDWSVFPANEQAAFALARRLTLEPHLLTSSDIDQCKKHYSELQILEMVLSVAGNNAINRWKEGVGVPQSSSGGNFGGQNREAGEQKSHSYLTDTSASYQNAKSKIVNAPAVSNGSPSTETVMDRSGALNVLSVKQGLQECSKRSPRLPIVSQEKARESLGELAPKESVPAWMRLLANFPIAGKRQVAAFVATENELQLSPLLRAQMSWVIAKQNGAWYSLSEAQKRLIGLGQSSQQIALLEQANIEQSERLGSPSDRALLVVAKNLATSPVILTDSQVANAVKLSSARDVVQTVHYTAMRSLFDRFTEAACLVAD